MNKELLMIRKRINGREFIQVSAPEYAELLDASKEPELEAESKMMTVLDEALDKIFGQ